VRKILIAVAALAVLGGGGAGAYFFVFKKPAETTVAAGEDGADAHAESAAPANNHKTDDHAAAKDEHGGGDGHGDDKGPTFVKLDPLVVPVMDSEGISQTISMMIVFEVTDEEAGKKLESLKPRLKDAMITNMYGLMNHQAALDKGVLQVGYVKQRLNAIAQKVMGDGVIKDVLLQMVQQNPV
jgi:flagellar protein FliL